MIYAMITGIPNVGKSTLINRIAGRSIAKTGNEAAMTRMQQRIEISPELTLIDTPGMLWPNIENENSGYRLAASGAIKDTAMGIEDVAFYLADYLIKRYPTALKDRYDLASVPDTELEFIELMGARRGCLSAGGRVDLEKASAILVNEFRAGMLGPITLETPEMIARENAARQATKDKKSEGKQARKETRRAEYKAKRKTEPQSRKGDSRTN